MEYGKLMYLHLFDSEQCSQQVECGSVHLSVYVHSSFGYEEQKNSDYCRIRE